MHGQDYFKDYVVGDYTYLMVRVRVRVRVRVSPFCGAYILVGYI